MITGACHVCTVDVRVRFSPDPPFTRQEDVMRTSNLSNTNPRMGEPSFTIGLISLRGDSMDLASHPSRS
jgi:hypothetical protein